MIKVANSLPRTQPRRTREREKKIRINGGAHACKNKMYFIDIYIIQMYVGAAAESYTISLNYFLTQIK